MLLLHAPARNKVYYICFKFYQIESFHEEYNSIIYQNHFKKKENDRNDPVNVNKISAFFHQEWKHTFI